MIFGGLFVGWRFFGVQISHSVKLILTEKPISVFYKNLKFINQSYDDNLC